MLGLDPDPFGEPLALLSPKVENDIHFSSLILLAM